MYEIIYDFSMLQLEKNGLDSNQKEEMMRGAIELNKLSVALDKKLIVFFYRDPIVQLPFENALVFRTSGFRETAGTDTFGMPAIVEKKPFNEQFVLQKKVQIPAISFRGKASPLTLPPSVWAREQINRFAHKYRIPIKIKNYQPEGYLLRRRALLSCIKAGDNIQLDYLIDPAYNNPDYQSAYIRSFLKNQYIICCAGFGNYSYRLFETLREGRIPVYIDTDELLPCADKIDWKSKMIWIPQADVDRTAAIVLDFHHSIHPDDFAAMQQENRNVYFNYFTEESFGQYLLRSFLPNYIGSYNQNIKD